MKIVSLVKLIFIIIGLGVASALLYQKSRDLPLVRTYEKAFLGPCDRPIVYAIGKIDPQFGLSESDFLATAQAAEQVWENQSGKDLFRYDPQATLKLNMIFDERQQQSLEAEELEGRLDELKIADEKIRSQYEALSDEHSALVKDYNSLVKKYEAKLEEYNDTIDHWNARGGVPKNIYEELKDEKGELEMIYEKLEKKRKDINRLVSQINDLVSQENKVVSTYNTAANTYRNKYGGAREFEKGLYDGQNINIYQFTELSDLKLTIAHEIGHALSLGHVENPQSLMYYLLGEQNLDNPQLTPEDLNALNTLCPK